MDEQLGNPIPLAEIKEISEPTLDEEYDMPDISHLKEGFEIPFEVKMKKTAIKTGQEEAGTSSVPDTVPEAASEVVSEQNGEDQTAEASDEH